MPAVPYFKGAPKNLAKICVHALVLTSRNRKTEIAWRIWAEYIIRIKLDFKSQKYLKFRKKILLWMLAVKFIQPLAYNRANIVRISWQFSFATHDFVLSIQIFSGYWIWTGRLKNLKNILSIFLQEKMSPRKKNMKNLCKLKATSTDARLKYKHWK